jgi:hypothetical protein
MICLFESRNQKETKTTYNVHEGQASINGGHAKEKGKKKTEEEKTLLLSNKERKAAVIEKENSWGHAVTLKSRK